MARRPDGLRTLIKVVKTINKAQKQAEQTRQRSLRERERSERAFQLSQERAQREKVRETNQRIKQAEKAFYLKEKEKSQAQRNSAIENKKAIKDEIELAKRCYEERIENRRIAKNNTIEKFLR